MIKCVDSAYPVNVFPVPDGFTAVQGYIGRRSPFRTPTPHLWVKDEWQKFPGYHKYPMFVASIAIGEQPSVREEAFECLQALYDIGCPKNKVVGLDLEEAVNPAYVNEFFNILHYFGGYKVWVYGSASSVFDNPQCNGYDPADWTGEPHLVSRTGVRATQYADSTALGTGYDARVIKDWQAQSNLWK